MLNEREEMEETEETEKTEETEETEETETKWDTSKPFEYKKNSILHLSLYV